MIRFLTNCSFIEELDNNPDMDRNETLGHFVQSRGYSELFQKAFLVRLLKLRPLSYVHVTLNLPCSQIPTYKVFFSFQIPICASIWSCSAVVMTFSAYLILSFLRNHDNLEVDFCIQW